MQERPLMKDSRTRDRHFRRNGWRWAWMVTLTLLAAMVILFRIEPTPEAASAPPAPRWMWVLPAEGQTAMDARAVHSPAIFALPTPAGFSHALRTERARVTPPVRLEQAFSPAPTGMSLNAAWLSQRTEGKADADFSTRWKISGDDDPHRLAEFAVFAERAPMVEEARMEFPEGWEPRLFSGVDLAYAGWSDAGWRAQVEVRFDDTGVPQSVVVAQSSGVPAVDRRLARSVSGWRLLAADAPRAGRVKWMVPASPVASAPPVAAMSPPVVSSDVVSAEDIISTAGDGVPAAPEELMP